MGDTNTSFIIEKNISYTYLLTNYLFNAISFSSCFLVNVVSKFISFASVSNIISMPLVEVNSSVLTVARVEIRNNNKLIMCPISKKKLNSKTSDVYNKSVEKVNLEKCILLTSFEFVYLYRVVIRF